jgi:hypothetical protein
MSKTKHERTVYSKSGDGSVIEYTNGTTDVRDRNGKWHTISVRFNPAHPEGRKRQVLAKIEALSLNYIRCLVLNG